MKEFKEFATKGNVIDLAVGVIIGGAFGKIIDSVIGDLVMPIVAKIIGSPDFTNAYLDLNGVIPDGTPLAKAREMGPVLAYGNFITVLINFLLLAMVIFLMIKGINRLRRKEPPPPPPTPQVSSTDKLLMEIRDALKNR